MSLDNRSLSMRSSISNLSNYSRRSSILSNDCRPNVPIRRSSVLNKYPNDNYNIDPHNNNNNINSPNAYLKNAIIINSNMNGHLTSQLSVPNIPDQLLPSMMINDPNQIWNIKGFFLSFLIV